MLGRQQASLAIVLACAALTYGGVSLFVVAFAVYPIASALFRAADVPRRLVPATIALGAFTFTMTALPGTPAIQNAIPMPYFGTTPFAAPGLGLIAACVMFGLGQAWLASRVRSAKAAGEGFAGPEDAFLKGETSETEGKTKGPSLFVSALPIVVVVVANYAFSAHLLPAIDTSYLARPDYGETTLSSVLGLWSVSLALTLAILVSMATAGRRLADPTESVGQGAGASLLPIFNTASLVGFGAVVASLPAFDLVRSGIDGLGGGPLVSLALSTGVLAGMTGSASGGMTIALDALGAEYLERARMAEISPELLHRITTIATGGLDALPHNGAVVTLLSIGGLTHARAYGDVFVVAVAAPLVALCVVLALGTALGSF